jgi:magnesium transporter
MTDLDVQDAAAKADNMANPAFLAASVIEERAPDIVEALNEMPLELAVAVLLHLPPDRGIEVLDQPGLEREPELVTLMPREAAAILLAGVSADRLADIFRQVKEPHCSELLDMRDDLDRERKTMMRMWAKREEQLKGVLDSTAGLYGDLQASPDAPCRKSRASTSLIGDGAASESVSS